MTLKDGERPLRADAARNRAKILQTASRMFAEQGLAVTMDDIAREAGLGTGTVYRRFADREALVEALFEDKIRATIALAEECAQDTDPWQAFTRLIVGTCSDMASDKGLRQLMLSDDVGYERMSRERNRLVPIVRLIIERAQQSGDLRADVRAEDVPMVLLMVGTVHDFAGERAPDLWRRYLAALLTGLRADAPDTSAGALGLVPAALDDADLNHSMQRWRIHGRR